MALRNSRRMRIGVGSILILIALGAMVALVQQAGAHSKKPVSGPRAVNTISAGTSCSRWYPAQGQNPSADSNTLQAIAAVSGTDIWAVGNYYDQASVMEKSLTEHWNGSAWSVVPSPNPAAFTNWLDGATAIASDDVWAVGWSQAASGGLYSTLTEHWDGNTWTAIPSPNGPSASSNNNALADVSAASTSDVWAVGTDGGAIPLVEHWNGTEWSVVTMVPAPGNFENELTSVVALSASDVWVAGFYRSTGEQVTHPLFDHFDGTSWTQVVASNPGWNDSEIQSLAAVSNSDVWAVGYGGVSGSSTYQPLTEHWDGAGWTVVPSPEVNGSPTFLLRAAATASNNVWAVGYFATAAPQYRGAVIVQWNGTAWQIAATPNPGIYSALYGVAAISSRDAWAVGLQNLNPGPGGLPQATQTTQTTQQNPVLIEHFNPSLMLPCATG